MGALAQIVTSAALLVTPGGDPVGGELQEWANGVPGLAGRTIVVSYSNPAGREEPAYTFDGGPIFLTGTSRVSRYQFVHELGHHIDYGMSDAARVLVMRHVIFRRGAWRQDGGNSPHEQFAEAVALLTVRYPDGGFGVRLGPRRKALLKRWLTVLPDVVWMQRWIAVFERRWALEDERIDIEASGSACRYPPARP